ncbi:hypothetical protein Acr_00g0076310 [Actinidia rufa]|uniref:Uncharacterized protein n=1 Tax=Actinidia rufa TaxID=165716 RepID=A0A7J0DSX1_9ERIC|nr:hypothetical protein Acr_00g0076310 [Actinidia rufa]
MGCSLSTTSQPISLLHPSHFTPPLSIPLSAAQSIAPPLFLSLSQPISQVCCSFIWVLFESLKGSLQFSCAAGVDAASAKAGFNFLGCVCRYEILKLDWRLSDESPSEDCGEVESDAVYREFVTCKVCLAFTANLISSGVRDTIFVSSPDLLRRP